MGCHAGLDIDDAEVDASLGATSPVDDWAKTFADSGALWVANTGYGYADTDTVAYSAKLMAEFASNLNGTVTIGEALSEAKQQYAADSAILSPYDLKALMESTFYGLPMYSLNGTPTGQTPPAPGPSTMTDSLTGETVAPVSLSLGQGTSTAAGQLGLVTTADGSYYQVNGYQQRQRRDPDDRVPPDRAARDSGGDRAESRSPRRARDRPHLTGHSQLPARVRHAGRRVRGRGAASHRRRRFPGHPATRRRPTGPSLAAEPALSSTLLPVSSFRTLRPPQGAVPSGSSPRCQPMSTTRLRAPRSQATTRPPRSTLPRPSTRGNGLNFTVEVTPSSSDDPVERVLVLYTDAASPNGTWTALDLNSGDGLELGGHRGHHLERRCPVHGRDGRRRGQRLGLEQRGDSDFNSQIQTTTTLSSSANPGLVGQQITFTATVGANVSGTGNPAGNVEFLDNGDPITACGGASGKNLSNAAASCVVSYPSAGLHQITATYAGNTDFITSTTAAPLDETVNQPSEASPSTSLVASSTRPWWARP